MRLIKIYCTGFSTTVTSLHEAHSSASCPQTMHIVSDQEDSSSQDFMGFNDSEIKDMAPTETEPIIVSTRDCTTQTYSEFTNQSQSTQTDSNMVSYSQ